MEAAPTVIQREGRWKSEAFMISLRDNGYSGTGLVEDRMGAWGKRGRGGRGENAASQKKSLTLLAHLSEGI